MALKCGPNKFAAAAGGGAINANPLIAILVAFAKFAAQLGVTLQQAQRFLNQQCPDNCPKKKAAGPMLGAPKFSIKFSPKKATWQAGFTCTVTATIQCI